MQVTFNTQNKDEVSEVLALLTGTAKVEVEQPVEKPVERKAKTPTKPKVEEVIPEVTPKPKTASSVSLEELKNLAKDASSRVDREAVKACIAKHAPKLTMVMPDEYTKLAEELKAL